MTEHVATRLLERGITVGGERLGGGRQLSAEGIEREKAT